MVTPGLRRQAWLIEAMGPANSSEGLGWPSPIDKSEGFKCARLAQGPLIKVTAWRGWAAAHGVDKAYGKVDMRHTCWEAATLGAQRGAIQ